MAEEDDRRVEARLDTSRGGLTATPEYIDALRKRREEFDRLPAKAPLKAFASVLKEAGSGKRETKEEALPTRKAPLVGLRRPAEKDDYGVKGPSAIVLKG